MTQLFRSMQPAADDKPECGQSSRKLGVRSDIDIPVDADGQVGPDEGGLSVSPDDPHRLPEHRRPPEFGGTGKDPVWSIEEAALGPELLYRADPDDPDNHGFVEPARQMPFTVYEQALEATASNWQRIDR